MEASGHAEGEQEIYYFIIHYSSRAASVNVYERPMFAGVEEGSPIPSSNGTFRGFIASGISAKAFKGFFSAQR